MARDLDNSFVEGNSQATGNRTQPQANEANTVQLKGIPKALNNTYAATFTYAYVESTDTLTFTPVSGNVSGIKFYRWVVTDGKGNEVAGNLDLAETLATPVAVDTSSLDKVEGMPTIYFNAADANGHEVAYKIELEAGALRADF